MTVTTTEEDSKIDIPILKKNLEGKQAHRYQNHHSHNTIEKSQKSQSMPRVNEKKPSMNKAHSKVQSVERLAKDAATNVSSNAKLN